ncbi:MAG: glycosyltransferase family 4 protein [Desulfobulbaceae bacterium]|jgi:phosphatidylinositol alpha-1,6-mannosyltransferase|nr:glycosyltransferase family 4 protein [Desulfobulbaceae bacterium]
MKDILLCSDFYPMIGGAHHWLYNVYSRWPSQVTVFAGSPPNNDSDAIEQQRVFDAENHGSLSIHRIELSFPDINILSFTFWKRLLNAVRSISSEAGNDEATLNCLRAFPDGIMGLAWKSLSPRKRKIVTFAHGEEIGIASSSRQLKILSYWVYKISTLVIANSMNTERLVHSLVPSAQTTVIHPGVTPADFSFSEEELERGRSFYGFTQNDIVLVTVGRMEIRKNHGSVLNAMRHLLDSGIQLKYLIVGGGEEEQRLRIMVKNLGIEWAVKFTGFLPNRERSLAMAAADIHIMPSINHDRMFEGFGIVFIEAAAAGIPSIAGNTGGQAEAVLDRKTGLVIDGANVDAIVGAIKQLAENRRLRRALGEAGRQWAMAHEWTSIAGKTAQKIRHAAGK